MPDHRSIPASVVTPRSGRNSGMIGLRKLNDMVMMNWMPTMAHNVVCQWDSPLPDPPPLCGRGASASAPRLPQAAGEG